jgi:hypothetical protein
MFHQKNLYRYTDDYFLTLAKRELKNIKIYNNNNILRSIFIIHFEVQNLEIMGEEFGYYSC